MGRGAASRPTAASAGSARCPPPRRRLTSTETLLAYVGCLWRGASVVALSLKPSLAAVRKRLLAADQPNPCDDDRVREAKAGFCRAGITYRPVIQLARVPLPAFVAWQLAALALRSPTVRRHQLTAVVLQFWWMRRAEDITRLTLGDDDVRADGTSAYQVPRHKTCWNVMLNAAVSPPAEKSKIQETRY